jgi:hypothetical protein
MSEPPISGKPDRVRPSREKTILDCPCGARLIGRDQPDLLRLAREHLREAHPQLEYTDEQILFMAF